MCRQHCARFIYTSVTSLPLPLSWAPTVSLVFNAFVFPFLAQEYAMHEYHVVQVKGGPSEPIRAVVRASWSVAAHPTLPAPLVALLVDSEDGGVVVMREAPLPFAAGLVDWLRADVAVASSSHSDPLVLESARVFRRPTGSAVVVGEGRAGSVSPTVPLPATYVSRSDSSSLSLFSLSLSHFFHRHHHRIHPFPLHSGVS